MASIDRPLVLSDPSLSAFPALGEEIGDTALDLQTYVQLVLKDLARAATPYQHALSLVDEGNVALARKVIAGVTLSAAELAVFGERCLKTREAVEQLIKTIGDDLTQHAEQMHTQAQSQYATYKAGWEYAFQQERYHIARRTFQQAVELVNTARQALSGTPARVEPEHEALPESPPETSPAPEAQSAEAQAVAERVSLLDEAIRVWNEMMSRFSAPLRDLVRPISDISQRPLDTNHRVALWRSQRQRDGWVAEAQKTLQQHFYLSQEHRKQHNQDFFRLLLLYAFEQAQSGVKQKDFDLAMPVVADVISILDTERQIDLDEQTLIRICQLRIETQVVQRSRSLEAHFPQIEEWVREDLALFPRRLTDPRRRSLLADGAVLFFYYRIQYLREKVDFRALIDFYNEHSLKVANLAETDLELVRLLDSARNIYEEALYRRAERDLLGQGLPDNMSLDETLKVMANMAPYQLVPALRHAIERFADTRSSESRNLTQTYRLLLALLEMQSPEELVFDIEYVNELIQDLQTSADRQQLIQLVPAGQCVRVEALDALKEFIAHTTQAVSVTNLPIVRQNITHALAQLTKQREWLDQGSTLAAQLWNRLIGHWTALLVARQKALSRQVALQLTLQDDIILVNQQSSLVVYIRNAGPGHAQNIEIALISSDLTIPDPIRKVKLLRNGDERSVIFAVSPRIAQGFCEIRLLLRFITDDNFPIISSQEHTLQTKAVATRTIPAASPYVVGPPLMEKAQVFYGREYEFEFLRTRFWGSERNKVIAIQGERRMGKTSILYQIKARKIFGNSRVVFFDLQGRYANISSMQEFFFNFARRVASEANLPPELRVEQSQFFHGHKQDYDVFERWLDRVEAELERRETQIVVMFDEFERLLEQRFLSLSERRIDELMQYLRSLMLTRTRFNWIIAGSWSLVAKQREYFSSLFGLTLNIWISYLRREDAMALIQQPVASYLSYDQQAIERILRLTGGHPYHIQVICDELLNRARSKYSNWVSVEDVDNVIEHVLRQVHENAFRTIWSSLGSSLTRRVLSATAEATQNADDFVDKRTLFRFLRRQRPGENENNFYAALDLEDGELMVRELIELHPSDAARIRVRSELLHRWLQKYKPLSTVMRDEP